MNNENTIESQVINFEKKIQDDTLKAFNDLLDTYRTQKAVVDELTSKLNAFKVNLESYAKAAHYQVNWESITATKFNKVGECMSCKQKNVGLVDYNGHGHWVCEICDRCLNNEFEDEYK